MEMHMHMHMHMYVHVHVHVTAARHSSGSTQNKRELYGLRMKV